MPPRCWGWLRHWVQRSVELHPQEVRQQHRILGQQEGPPPAIDRRCLVLGPPADLQQHQAGKRSSAKEGYGCQVSRHTPELSYHLCAVCVRCAEWCVHMCVRWCRVVYRFKYYSMGGRKILCGGAAPRPSATPPET